MGNLTIKEALLKTVRASKDYVDNKVKLPTTEQITINTMAYEIWIYFTPSSINSIKELLGCELTFTAIVTDDADTEEYHEETIKVTFTQEIIDGFYGTSEGLSYFLIEDFLDAEERKNITGAIAFYSGQAFIVELQQGDKTIDTVKDTILTKPVKVYEKDTLIDASYMEAKLPFDDYEQFIEPSFDDNKFYFCEYISDPSILIGAKLMFVIGDPMSSSEEDDVIDIVRLEFTDEVYNTFYQQGGMYRLDQMLTPEENSRNLYGGLMFREEEDGQSIVFSILNTPSEEPNSVYYKVPEASLEIKVKGYANDTLVDKEYVDGAIGNIGTNSNIDTDNLVVTNSISMDRKEGTTIGAGSVAVGNNVEASGYYSHAEGTNTKASGFASHAEGSNTEVSGYASHAEGHYSEASGDYSHAEGFATTASGEYSHAEGARTIASSEYQHVQGRYNIEDTEDKYAHIVGNGTHDGYDENGDAIITYSNAHTLDWNGNAWFAGEVKIGADNKVLATKEYVDNNKFSGSYNDLTNKPTIPSIQGLASESYVNQQISKIQHPTYDDSTIKSQLANKADKSELFSGDYNDLSNKPTIPSIDGLATENFVTNKIAEAQLEIEGDVIVDLKGYATKDELNLKADKTEVPSIEGLASESYVQQEIAKITPGGGGSGSGGDDGVSDEEKEYVDDMMYSALGGLRFIKITQERYDALSTKDPNTIYIVVSADELNNSTGETDSTDIYNLRWTEGSNLNDTGAVVTNESQAAYRLSDFVKVNSEYNYKVVTSSSSQFQVFYYDRNKNYIGKSTIRNDKTEFAIYGYEGFMEFPEDVKYFRIRTNNKTSSVEMSEIGKRDDTFVPFQFRSGYTVASNGSVSAASGYMTSGDIKLEPDYDYNITFKGNKTRVVFFNTDGNKTGNCLPTDSTYYEGETTLTRADIPEAAVSFRMRFATGGEVNMNNIHEHLQVVKTPKASKYLVEVSGWIASQGFDESGAEVDDISAMRSGYVSITSGYDYMYTLKQGVPFGFQIYYYDSSKTFISCSEVQDDPCGNIRFDIPSGAAYFRLKVSQENSLTFDNVDSNVVIKKIPTVSGMLYQFGVLSDVHVDAGSDGNFYDTNHATNDYRKAVKFMEDEGAQFVAYGGDMATGDPGVSEQDYRKVLEILKDAYIPHYMISGNHDYGYFFKALIESRKYYVVEKENDMFIFVNAQSRGNTGGVDREIIDGVQSLIEQNPNKRIFLFFHYFIRNHGSGDGLQDVKYYTGDTLGDAYDQYPLSLEWANLIINSPNVIFCHGHSHFRFKCQEVYEFNNYYHADGECHSVHIPSCAVPREMSADSTSVTNMPEGSEGYMVRVFADRVEFHAVQLSAYRYLTTYNFTINLPQGN